MALIRISDVRELRASHVIMLAIALVALAGVALLTSADKTQALPDGAVAWRPDSPLLAIVEILNLQNRQPTVRGTAIKYLVHGLASGAGLMVAILGLVALGRQASTAADAETVIDIEKVAARPGGTEKRHVDPTRTAQALLLAYLAWAFLSATWSHAPGFSVRGATLVAIQAAWAFALGFGLNRRAATWAGNALLAVLSVTAVVAIAYHRERNPTLRASYPIGNPLLLAGVLIPALVLAAAMMVKALTDVRRGKVLRGIAMVAYALVAALATGYAFKLAASRGPAVGLGIAALGIMYFAGGKRWKIAATALAIIGLVFVASKFYAARDASSATGRSTTIRVRLHSWDYGLQLLAANPLRGAGQGAYALTAERFVTPEDVLADPEGEEYRFSNAHCEWLEVGGELGSIGLVLVISALGLTLLGVARTAPTVVVPQQRWTLIGLGAALVGLCAAEAFSVGLRLEGFPLVFYTVLGLVWALTRPLAASEVAIFSRQRALGVMAGLAGIALGLVVIEVARADYASARAEFDAGLAFDEADYTRAADLAEQGYRDRLSPQRRSTAMYGSAAMYIRIGEALRQQYLTRLATAQSKGQIDAAFAAHLQDSRAQLLASLAEGGSVLDRLQAADLSRYEVGWLVYSLNLLRADLADMEGDGATAAASRHAGATALEQQLLRRPFEPNLAARFVAEVAGSIEPGALLELLARPLRLRRAPPAYAEIVDAWGKSQPFAEVVVPMLDALSQRPVEELAALAEEPWAAEKLRVGALAAFLHGDNIRAIGYLNQASKLYERLTPRAPLAYASTLAELADAQFANDPVNPDLAMKTAEQAVKDAPRSEFGRALAETVGQRLLIYRLAAGQEQKARDMIVRLTGATGAELDALLADRYVNLAYGVFNQMAVRKPEQLLVWSRRAVELAPDFAPAWFLAADLAILDGETYDFVRTLFQVFRCGGSAENISALVDRALPKFPDLEILHDLYAHFHASDESDADAEFDTDANAPGM
jgi:O-antigen ligase